jgi:hypothetical protein
MTSDPQDVCFEIAGKGYTQDQASSIAFNAYCASGRTVEAGFLTWQKIVRDPDLTHKDYAFLLLYFFDKFVSDEDKKKWTVDLKHIKEHLK